MTFRRRRRLFGATGRQRSGILAIAAIAALTAPWPAHATTLGGPAPMMGIAGLRLPEYGISAPGRLVDWVALPPPPPASPSADLADLHPEYSPWTLDGGTPRAAIQLPGTISAPNAPARQTSSSGPTLSVAARFAGMSNDLQASQFRRRTRPPDSQVAAGSSVVLEATNSVISAWSKQGTLLRAADLTTFFPVDTAAGYTFSDPRVLYDAGGGRWFMSGMAFDSSNDSAVFLAVSSTSNPLDPWMTYEPYSNTAGVMADQPRLGFTDDKVTIGWNDFSGSSASSFSGQETLVLQKSDVMAGRKFAFAHFPPASGWVSVQPAQSMTGTLTQYLTYTRTYSQVGVVALTGTPATADVHWTEARLTVAPLSQSPPAHQPGGALPLDTGDSRILGATWQAGSIWATMNDACLAPGDSSPRACARVFQFSTSGTPTVAQDYDAGRAGVDVFDPSATLDAAGELFVQYTISSPSSYASVGAFAEPADQSLVDGGVFQPGLATYGGGGAPYRWGDYGGAAQDPANPATVWVVGEYATSSANDVGNWGTGIAQLTLGTVTPAASPSPSPTPSPSASPSPSPWPSPSASPSAQPSPSASPAAPTGGQFIALPPTRILDTRAAPDGPIGTCSPSCTTLGSAQFLDVQVTGAGGIPGDGSVSGVALNVTETNAQGPASYLSVYPTGTPRPNSSTQNFTAGQTRPNLVDVPVGTGGQVRIYNNAGSVDVLLDVAGYFTRSAGGGAGLYRPLVPARIMDTRSGIGTCGGQSCARIHAGQVLDLQVAGSSNDTGGASGVPATGLSAVVLNATVTGAVGAPSYLTVYPSGQARPTVSNINFTEGQTVPNRVVVKVGTGGRVSIYTNTGDADVVIDVDGWYTDGSATSQAGTHLAANPARILDTRDGTGSYTGSTAGGSVLSLAVAGQGGVPTMNSSTPPTAVVVNITTTNHSGGGSFLTAYASDAPRPLASDLNYNDGDTFPNLAIVKLGADGRINLYNNSGSVDEIVDVEGWYQ